MRDEVKSGARSAEHEGTTKPQRPGCAHVSAGERRDSFAAADRRTAPKPVPDDVADPARDESAGQTATVSRPLHSLRDRFALLAESSLLLAESLDYETTLATVAGMALPYLGAWCIVDVTIPDNGIRRVAVLHPDPARQSIATELHDGYPPRPGDALGAPRVIKTGRPEVVADVADTALQMIAQDANHLRLLRAMGIGAYVIVPMVARRRVVGAITFVTTEAGQRFGDLDLALAKDLASRAALAVDNAQTHAAALLAGQTAEAAEAVAREKHSMAERVSRGKSDFLAFMSHELRTPLGAIGAYAELLEMTAAGSLSEEQQKFLRGIRRNQQQLVRLANDIVHYAQGESGMVRYIVEEVELAAVLRDCEEMLGAQCQALDIALRIDACDGTLRAHADEQKLHHILINLISNAGKFTDPGGCVTLSCTAVCDGDVEVVVVDTGRGIAANQLERIFEPFVQAAESDARTEGVGLGLAISRTWARGMGGDLTVTSAPGEGSRFTLTLPRA